MPPSVQTAGSPLSRQTARPGAATPLVKHSTATQLASPPTSRHSVPGSQSTLPNKLPFKHVTRRSPRHTCVMTSDSFGLTGQAGSGVTHRPSPDRFEQTSPGAQSTSSSVASAWHSSSAPGRTEHVTRSVGTSSGDATQNENTQRASVGATPAVEQNAPKLPQSPSPSARPSRQLRMRFASRQTLAVPLGGHAGAPHRGGAPGIHACPDAAQSIRLQLAVTRLEPSQLSAHVSPPPLTSPVVKNGVMAAAPVGESSMWMWSVCGIGPP